MNKTAKQPAGALATNPNPTPITDRQKEVYHKRTALDKLILGVVVVIALVVIALSFSNTKLLARELGLNEYLTAGLVEILFASLLFIRGRQRATQRNVPIFLTAGYFISLAFVTGVNMWGLSMENQVIGPVVGIAISGSMWLMESTLVWLWTDSHQPHKKSAKELEREAKREIEEIKIMQKIDWMRWEAQKPSLDLIRKARKEEERRKETVEGGMPEFFVLTSAIQPVRSANQSMAEMADSQPTAQPSASHSTKETNQDYQPAILISQSPANQSLAEVEQSIIGQPAPRPAADNQPAISANNQPKISQMADRGESQPTNQVNEVDGSASQSAAKQDQPSATANHQPDRSTTNQKKKSTNRNQATIQPAAKVVEVAEKYRKENGKWPSQRGLAELAGVTRHQASKVLSQLKAEESSSQQPAKQAKQANG